MGQQADGDQGPQRIDADARAAVGQGLEMFDQRTDLRSALRAAGPGPGFDARERGLELVGLENYAGRGGKVWSEEGA